jgi:hypothetical protein
MDLERVWRSAEGEKLSARDGERLTRRLLRRLSELTAIGIAEGLYTPREECCVQIARRDRVTAVVVGR